METESLGDRLRVRRKELGLTLADVAKRSGLSLPYISNLERSRGNPTLDALESIARALETTVSALTGDRRSDSPESMPMPKSLRTFLKSEWFQQQVTTLATKQGLADEEMRERLATSMQSAPRRSVGDPTEQDWRRLLDVYRLILDEPR